MNENDKKEAHRAYWRAYREKNRERLRARQKAWRESHREQNAERMREWRKTHLEQVRQASRKCYRKHWFEYRTRAEQYRREHPEAVMRFRKRKNDRLARIAFRSKQTWTQQELQLLVILADQNGLSSAEISKLMGRSWYSICTKRQQIKQGLLKERDTPTFLGEGI